MTKNVEERIANLEKQGIIIHSGKEVMAEQWYKEYETQDLWYAVSEKWYVSSDIGGIVASFDKIEDALKWCEGSKSFEYLYKYNGWYEDIPELMDNEFTYNGSGLEE